MPFVTSRYWGRASAEESHRDSMRRRGVLAGRVHLRSLRSALRRHWLQGEPGGSHRVGVIAEVMVTAVRP